MKKIIATALLTFACTNVHAYDAQQIVDAMSNLRPDNVLLERLNLDRVNSDSGIVKIEHVFVKNDIRYTVWHLDWYDKTRQPDELRVYFRKNGSVKHDRINLFSVYLNSTDVNLSYHYPDGRIEYYNEYPLLSMSKITKEEAVKVISEHMEIISKAYGL